MNSRTQINKALLLVMLLVVGISITHGFGRIWTFSFLTAWFYLLLRACDMTLSELIKIKVVSTTLKVLLWCAIAVIGVLVLMGLFSFFAGLGAASTIIIILLFLIWLK